MPITSRLDPDFISPKDDQTDVLSEMISSLKEELRLKSLSAARWDALINCARIRVLGSAGLISDTDPYGKPHGNSAHLGLELWTQYPEGTSPENTKLLEKFADKAMAAQAESKEAVSDGLNSSLLARNFLDELKTVGGLNDLLILAVHAFEEGHAERDSDYGDSWNQCCAAQVARLRRAGVLEFTNPIKGLNAIPGDSLPSAEQVDAIMSRQPDGSCSTCMGIIEQAFEDGYFSFGPAEECIRDYETSDAILIVKSLIQSQIAKDE